MSGCWYVIMSRQMLPKYLGEVASGGCAVRPDILSKA
jgi:hypothetical protein